MSPLVVHNVVSPFFTTGSGSESIDPGEVKLLVRSLMTIISALLNLLVVVVGTCLQCFDTVGWVLGRASSQKKGYLSGARCKLFAIVHLMPLLPHHRCFIKIQNGFPLLCWLTQVVQDKRPINECYVCCCCCLLLVACKFIL